MKTQTIIAIKFLMIMTIMTGIIYPFLMTGLAQLIFPARANGSLVMKDGRIAGSELVGQKFDSNIYFWPRPSAIDYNPIPSGASNLGPTSDKLKKQVKERRRLFVINNLITDTTAIPKEMLFASASGLDPHISPESALLQLNRVAGGRNLDEVQIQKVKQLIKNKTQGPQYFLFGEPRINVFDLNLALDSIR
ncbi:MAG TPA: potassium-transporting ATPase subunit KdpC [Bacteroidales bacterium]|jgi:potassium-transporting ATPase KdpC subunit|nr:potassium-transporting ATPase subunit KdpC [Bacteroidales bacterium]HBZ21391.1 potassium-transporting ATPase subunit KdpC [Bacteroidales bacterium]